MKSIIHKKDHTKRNQIILGIGLVLVMLASTFGIVVNSFGEEKISNKISYNGFEFVNQNGFWFTIIGDNTFVFKNNPKEIENKGIKLEQGLGDYYYKPLYIDSKENGANSEIYNNLDRIALRIQSGCFEEPCEKDVPIKTCKENLIVIKESRERSITTNESCVFIQGPEENLTLITDEFLFKLVGIQ